MEQKIFWIQKGGSIRQTTEAKFNKKYKDQGFAIVEKDDMGALNKIRKNDDLKAIKIIQKECDTLKKQLKTKTEENDALKEQLKAKK